MKLPLVSLVLLALSAPPLMAQNLPTAPKDYNAQTMMEMCQADKNKANSDLMLIACTFRVQGMLHMMMENCASFSQGFKPAPYLTAGPVPSGDAAKQAFYNLMEEQPNLWGAHWHHVMALAVSTTFPCDKQ